MKTIEVDDELYSYIASHTKHIGESASDILRRMLKFSAASQPAAPVTKEVRVASPAIVEAKPSKRLKTRFAQCVNFCFRTNTQSKSERSIALCCCCLHYILLTPRRLPKQRNRCRGRTRVYFAADEQTLLKNGNQTKPKHVPGTPYWVITNTNTGRKCSMIEHIMQSMQFPAELIEKVCGTI